jgi:sarcosine oxidase subunit beta
MADYVIIGGGVYGVAAAWHLAQTGAEVLVLERWTVASGASGGPGRRGVRANWRDRRELPLMREAYPVWEGIHDLLGQDGLFERTGNLKLVGREQDLHQAYAQAWMQSQFGIETLVLDAAQVREIEPEVEPGILGGILCPNDGVADHTATTRAYAAAARRAGVEIREETEVTGIAYSGGRASGVRLADGTEAEAAVGVLVLSNWSVPELLAGSADMPVWSEAFQVLVSRPVAEIPFRHVIGHTNRTLSLKEEPDNRVMISGGYRGHYDRKTHVGRAIKPSIDANVADTVATYPSLRGIEIEVADAGHLESVSVDHVPVIDRLPDCPNVWYATGWCGHGWAIAPVVAQMIAQFAVENTCPALLKPFALSRFG